MFPLQSANFNQNLLTLFELKTFFTLIITIDKLSQKFCFTLHMIIILFVLICQCYFRNIYNIKASALLPFCIGCYGFYIHYISTQHYRRHFRRPHTQRNNKCAPHVYCFCVSHPLSSSVTLNEDYTFINISWY